MGLTTAELETLTSACDTILPSVDVGGPSADFYRRRGSEIGVSKAMSEIVESGFEPYFREDFRRLLHILESRSYNLLLTGRPTKFAKLSQKDREAYLQGFRDSRLLAKRTAFQALKRLSCFFFYTIPDENGSNPSWQEIGYPGPDNSEATRLREDLRIIPLVPEGEMKLECDVCIVGAGAGGSVLAKELSEAGYSVVLLEAGSYGTPESFKQSELSLVRGLFQQYGTSSTKDLSFTLLGGRGSGGGTTVNWNTCLKPPPAVLQEWENEYGIQGMTGSTFAGYQEEVWSTLRVGTKESQMNWNNKAIWEGCRALGYKEGIDFEVVNRNAVGCNERCDFCTYGCRYACKQSTNLNYLPTAYKNGARFLFNTKVDHIVVEKGKARGVEARFSSPEKETNVRISARVVVAACGGLETPALLLRSGIKNKGIGRHFRLHPTAAIFGVFNREVGLWAGPPQTVAVRKFWNLNSTNHGFWIEAAPSHPGFFAFSVPWVDGRSHKEIMKNYARSTATIALLRDWGSGTVTVDSRGSPVVAYDLDRRDKENLMSGIEASGRILAAAGAVELWTTHSVPVVVKSRDGGLGDRELSTFTEQVRERGVEYNRMMLFSAHLMGSCRMSSDPSLGPTRQTGELYDVENLFIGDACVFPTAPGVNPMVTIMAMARRTSEFVKMKLSEVAR